MPIFPNNPYLGQLFIAEGKLWRWTGLHWGIVQLQLNNPPSTDQSGELTLEALEARITAIEEALQQSFLLID